MSVKLSDTLKRTLALIASHPAVCNVSEPSFQDGTDIVTFDVNFEISLPSSWRAIGESPSGVRLNEVVRLHFPSSFPLMPPEVSLRADFNRNTPHLQPWLNDGRPVPCIYEGALSELLHQEGMSGILNQLSDWLEKAALGTLIDPKQGWEPVRRDSFIDSLVANAAKLQALAKSNGGYKFLKLNYLRFATPNGGNSILGQVSIDTTPVSSDLVPKIFNENSIGNSSQLHFGKSLTLVVWAGKKASGELIICDSYLPETVENILDLKERAQLYGCESDLMTGLNWLNHCVSKYQSPHSFPLAIILLARRPLNIIGSQSPIEICSYIMDINSPILLNDGDQTSVRPAAHLHQISRNILTQMSGILAPAERLPWTLIGAGSLGSKLALHLARSGQGPDIVVDKSSMSPHNAARHALIPNSSEDIQISWLESKANLLCTALQGFDQSAKPLHFDVVDVSLNPKSFRKTFSNRPWAIVNATASMIVRETLTSSKLLPARVIETLLYSKGQVGVVTVEGPDRNPNTSDLMAEFYALTGQDSLLSNLIFNDDSVSKQNIGQGCGSLTMPMTDGRLSLSAAGMSEYLLKMLLNGLPQDCGEILIGQLSPNGLGLQWHSHQVPPVTIISMQGKPEWNVHLHDQAKKKIEAETSNWTSAETGGVLVGRFSEVTHTFHILDVIDAPEDSVRTKDEFILGTKGLQSRLESYSSAVGWALYCIGTWHSHLLPIGPSSMDRQAASTIALSQIHPAILLIKTPNGYHAVIADPAEKL